MDIFRLFAKPKPPVLTRCTHCDFEMELSHKEVEQLQKQNAHLPLCPIIEECDICHTGFMIPVDYTDSNGKTFQFHQLKPKIKPLDKATLIHRILKKADSSMLFPQDTQL